MNLLKLICLTFLNLAKQAWSLPQSMRPRSANNWRGGKIDSKPLDDSSAESRTYLLLAIVFGVAGLVWVVYGLMSPRWLFYPLLGAVNLAIACLCKSRSNQS